jgi:hypothetical protein
MLLPGPENCGCADPHEIEETAWTGSATAVSGFSDRGCDEGSLGMDINCGNFSSISILKIDRPIHPGNTYVKPTSDLACTVARERAGSNG